MFLSSFQVIAEGPIMVIKTEIIYSFDTVAQEYRANFAVSLPREKDNGLRGLNRLLCNSGVKILGEPLCPSWGYQDENGQVIRTQDFYNENLTELSRQMEFLSTAIAEKLTFVLQENRSKISLIGSQDPYRGGVIPIE